MMAGDDVLLCSQEAKELGALLCVCYVTYSNFHGCAVPGNILGQMGAGGGHSSAKAP